ncbi:MAG TPA: biosynthetic peptidoglycan transglycosylase, partial [Actinomycetota bacterium]
MSGTLPPQHPTHPQEPGGLPDPVRPEEPGRSRRRADRPTAPAAARASVRAAGRALGLLATEPRRRRAQRRARVELGRAVAAHLAGQPAPPLLATPMAAHRAAQLRLASTDPPPRPGPIRGAAGGELRLGSPPGPDQAPPGPGPAPASEEGAATRPSGTGSVAASKVSRPRARVASRASRSAGRHRDLAAELEWLLLIVVQFLPRLAAKMRLRVADGRLGAWATGLRDVQDPVVAAAREQAAEAQRAAASARLAASANWRQAVNAARLAVRLVSEAVADVALWIGHGIRSGSSMLVAWLISLVVAARHRVRHGSAAAGRHARAGSTATRASLRAGSAATRESLKAGSVAAGRGVRGAGRGVRGAGAGIAGAAGGLASRIDALADRGRSVNGSTARVDAPANGATARLDAPGNGATARLDTSTDEDRALDATMANGDPAATMPGTHDLGIADDAHPDGRAGARYGRAEPSGGARNGGPDGSGRLVPDRGDPIEAWWLPSSLVDRVEEPPPAAGQRAGRNGRPASRDPVVAGLASGLGRVARPFRAAGVRLAPLVTAMAAPPNRRRRGWLPFARPVVVALALTLLVATATAVPAGMLVADSVKGAGAGLPELEELRQLRQPERTQVYDRQGRVIEVLKDEQDRIVVPLSKISPTLQQAVIAAEDARFYEHKGVDDRGIVRAAVTNLLSGEVSQGGSTITQQLVRNSYPDL